MRSAPSRRHVLAVVLALVAAVLATLAPGAAAGPSSAPVAAAEPLLSSQFRTPPAAVRPKIRWWWSGNYGSTKLVQELAAISRAGFSGVEIAFDPEGWASAEQRQAMGAVLREAEGRGMTVDLTLGHTWPVRAPSVTPENGLAAQELVVGTQDLVGPAPYAGAPPAAKGGPPGVLHAVVAGRTLSPGTPALLPQAGPNLSPTGPTVAPVSPRVIDPSSLVVLTEHVGDDGLLRWDVPTGAWTVFGVWRRTTAEGSEDIAVMDHFSRAATTAVGQYIAENMVGRENLPVLRRVGGSFFEDSLEIDADDLFWTEEFTEQFRARRGYDPTPYLPFMVVAGLHHYPVWETPPAPDAELPDGAGERVRNDYLRTLTELYTHEHLRGFQEWAQTHDMSFRTQAAFGAALDVTRSARELTEAGGLADEESLNAGDPASPTDSNGRFAMDHYRSVVGGVHQGGGSEVHSELGAMFWRSWQAGLADYKAIMDKQWALGVTRPIPHGFANNPEGSAWPGRDRFGGIVSDSWNADHWPQWGLWRDLTDYWARGTLVLQHGRPQIDVAVYRDGFVTSAATFAALGTDAADHQALPALPGYDAVNPRGDDVAGTAADTPTPFFDGASLERRGWTFQYLDPAGLLEKSARGPGVLFPSGPSYRALIVDERAMPADSAEQLLAAARRGLRVVLVGPVPDRGTSLADAAAEDGRVRRAMTQLAALPTVRRVPAQGDVSTALGTLGLRPGAQWSEEVPLMVNHRVGKGVDYFYIWNGGEDEVRVGASLAAAGTPYRMDLVDGSVSRLGEYRTEGQRTVVPLRLTPGETTVIAVRRSGAGLHVVKSDGERVAVRGGSLELQDSGNGGRTLTLSDGTARTVQLGALPDPLVPQSWQLVVDDVGPDGTVRHELALSSLSDWRDIPAIRRASGTGRYRTAVDVPAAWLRADRGVRLDLGIVEGAFRLYVNGTRVSRDLTTDRPFADQPVRHGEAPTDVTRLLRPGSNEIVVEVVTTLKNRIVGLTEQGRPVGLGAGQPSTQPYGLLGPVSLVPEHRVILSGRR
jgi:hypothetical protein